jgi:hypothetical protein
MCGSIGQVDLHLNLQFLHQQAGLHYNRQLLGLHRWCNKFLLAAQLWMLGAMEGPVDATCNSHCNFCRLGLGMLKNVDQTQDFLMLKSMLPSQELDSFCSNFAILGWTRVWKYNCHNIGKNEFLNINKNAQLPTKSPRVVARCSLGFLFRQHPCKPTVLRMNNPHLQAVNTEEQIEPQRMVSLKLQC